MDHVSNTVGVVGSNETDAARRAEPSTKARSTPSLLQRLAHAESDIVDLVDFWNELPEAYVPGSDNWNAYENLERACELISEARALLIGDAR